MPGRISVEDAAPEFRKEGFMNCVVVPTGTRDCFKEILALSSYGTIVEEENDEIGDTFFLVRIGDQKQKMLDQDELLRALRALPQ
jgi:hypothetical protein